MADTRVEGIVVEPPGIDGPGDGGLLLRLEDGVELELIEAGMQTQMGIDMLWHQSRPTFEPYIGKKIAVRGYRGNRVLWSAVPEVEGE